MHIRLYDAGGKLLHELDRVVSRNITGDGEFIARFSPEAPRTTFVAYRNTWDHLEESADTGELPILAALESDSTEVFPRVQDPSPFGLQPPNDNRPVDLAVRRAMGISCRCNTLRCPQLLSAGADESEHYVRCGYEVGHDPEAFPCVWQEGMWIYGPAEHHPKCPRHPSKYNQPAPEEGHPVTGGITPDQRARALTAEPHNDQTDVGVGVWPPYETESRYRTGNVTAGAPEGYRRVL